MTPKHIVIDARIRRSSTGRYVDRLVEHLQQLDQANHYTVLVQPDDPWRPVAKNFLRVEAPYAQFSFRLREQVDFARQLRSLQPDLVHFPMNQQPFLYHGTVVTSTMDLTMLRFTRPGNKPLPIFWLGMAGYRWLFKRSIEKSAAIITITKFVKADLEQHYPAARGKITVTYCASEPPISAKPVMPEVLKPIFQLPSSIFQI